MLEVDITAVFQTAVLVLWTKSQLPSIQQHSQAKLEHQKATFKELNNIKKEGCE